MASLAAQADISTMRDPYEVLGVDKGATEDQIKAAYKKCALKYHPDKNRGDKAEEAADRFKEVVTAYNIVSDPDKRRRYDAGGFANLEASELSMELDLSSIGPMNTMFVAMFARLGMSSPSTLVLRPRSLPRLPLLPFQRALLCLTISPPPHHGL